MTVASMLAGIRERAFTIITTVIVAGLPIGGTAYLAGQQSAADRLGTLQVEEYSKLVDEQQSFDQLLEPFTRELALAGIVDKAKMAEMTASLVRQHQDVAAFRSNLDASAAPALSELQSSLNDVKTQLQLVENVQDMDQFGMALVEMQRSWKEVRPIIDAAVGKVTDVPAAR